MTALIEKVPIELEADMIAFFKRLCKATHLQLRVVAVESTVVLSSKLQNKSWLLNEVAALLDDEYWEV